MVIGGVISSSRFSSFLLRFWEESDISLMMIKFKKAASNQASILPFLFDKISFEIKKWTWWESNPRPYKETIRFLHVYSSLRFSYVGKTWTTNRHLIL